jgi:hypothetical protein
LIAKAVRRTGRSFYIGPLISFDKLRMSDIHEPTRPEFSELLNIKAISYEHEFFI